jgi:hypothetical protein
MAAGVNRLSGQYFEPLSQDLREKKRLIRLLEQCEDEELVKEGIAFLKEALEPYRRFFQAADRLGFGDG